MKTVGLDCRIRLTETRVPTPHFAGFLGRSFSASSDFTSVEFCNVWRDFWSSQPRGRCHGQPVGRGRGPRRASHGAWGSPHRKGLSSANVTSVQVANLWREDEVVQRPVWQTEELSSSVFVVLCVLGARLAQGKRSTFTYSEKYSSSQSRSSPAPRCPFLGAISASVSHESSQETSVDAWGSTLRSNGPWLFLSERPSLEMLLSPG